MKNNPLDYVFDSEGFEGMKSFVSSAFDYIPYLGKVLINRKINRTISRLNSHETQLRRISQLISSEKFSAAYIEQIQNNIAPIILSDLIEEHEDAKINYILNGFENIFIEQNFNENMILNYYDTLRGLRYEDVKSLYFYAFIIDEVSDSVETDSPEEAFYNQIYSKLERLYLVKSINTWEALEEGTVSFKGDRFKNSLTTYGKHFVNFITLDFNIHDYENEIKKHGNENIEKVKRVQYAKFG